MASMTNSTDDKRGAYPEDMWSGYRPEALHYHRHGPGLFGLSVEEIKAIKECQNEATWGFSVPSAIAFAGTTYFAVQQGYLKRNPRFGAAPKMMAAAFFGSIFGRYLYTFYGSCQDKLAKLQNSPIGDTARKLNEAGLRLPPYLIVAGSEPNPFLPGPWGWWQNSHHRGYGAGYRYFPGEQQTTAINRNGSGDADKEI